ncbi:MAG: hypothetical protein Q9191_008466 [Dirinaria sp. TL-2023a]
MVSITTLQTLLFTLGPLLLPRLISYWRTQRASAASSSRLPITAPPARVKRSLNILFISALLFLLSTLPIFSPENILLATSSRLQTPNDVLFTRLASLRPNKTLTASDELLKPRLASIDARCLYLTYGPDTLRRSRQLPILLSPRARPTAPAPPPHTRPHNQQQRGGETRQAVAENSHHHRLRPLRNRHLPLRDPGLEIQRTHPATPTPNPFLLAHADGARARARRLRHHLRSPPVSLLHEPALRGLRRARGARRERAPYDGAE